MSILERIRGLADSPIDNVIAKGVAGVLQKMTQACTTTAPTSSSSSDVRGLASIHQFQHLLTGGGGGGLGVGSGLGGLLSHQPPGGGASTQQSALLGNADSELLQLLQLQQLLAVRGMGGLGLGGLGLGGLGGLGLGLGGLPTHQQQGGGASAQIPGGNPLLQLLQGRGIGGGLGPLQSSTQPPPPPQPTDADNEPDTYFGGPSPTPAASDVLLRVNEIQKGYYITVPADIPLNDSETILAGVRVRFDRLSTKNPQNCIIDYAAHDSNSSSGVTMKQIAMPLLRLRHIHNHTPEVQGLFASGTPEVQGGLLGGVQPRRGGGLNANSASLQMLLQPSQQPQHPH